jgi:D-serine deaminase-like pyridoxal phosphate-dependent protein
MATKARANNLIFRPHFKTHQSAVIGEWFREAGVSCITVSSVTMAEYFADAGWQDILIAFPVNILEIDQINRVAQKINLSLLLESIETAEYIAKKLKHKVGIYLKIDTGNHRTGIASENTDAIQRVLDYIQNFSNLSFIGFLTHSGNTYSAKSRVEILSIHRGSVNQLHNLVSSFKNTNLNPIISIGDTPSCSIVTDFRGVDEIRPGNFIFYDVMQYRLGSCTVNDIAVALACPVVAKHPERNEIVIYGGAVHLSKESIIDADEMSNYGLIVKFHKNGWDIPIPKTYVRALSQEHGIIHTTEQQFSKIHVGDIVGVLPVHSCLTAHQMKEYRTFDDKRIQKMH